MAKKTKTEITPATTGQDEPTAIYEVACHSVEVDHLICYRTHRLRLTKSQADAINENQPESLRFIGI